MTRNYMQTDCPKCGHARNGPHRVNGCGMTAEIVEALRSFKRLHGAMWKHRLRLLWESGRDEGALRQARQVVGPGGRRLEKIQRTLRL